MKATILTNTQFSKLKIYNPGDINFVECILYMIGSARTLKGRRLLKKFITTNGEYLGRKLLNINTLIDNGEPLIETNKFILPDTLGIVGGEVIGCTIPFEEKSTNLELILKNPKIKLEEKINLLKQVGEIIEILSLIEGFPHEIHIGDVHEANFIMNEKGEIKTIDMDSAYISNNKPFNSKYLYLCSTLYKLPHKYKTNEEGVIIPSYNSDVFCYIMMILNTISSANIFELPIDDFYNYMNYLEDIEVPKDFLYCIEKIYNNANNETPLHYLDSLPIQNLYQAHKSVYKAKTGRKLSLL